MHESIKRISLEARLTEASDIMTHGITDHDKILKVLIGLYSLPVTDFMDKKGMDFLENIYEYTRDREFLSQSLTNITFSDLLKQVVKDYEYFTDDIGLKMTDIGMFVCNIARLSGKHSLLRDFFKINYRAFRKVLSQEFHYDICEIFPITAQSLSLKISDDDITVRHIFNYFNSAKSSGWIPLDPIDKYKKKITDAFELIEYSIFHPLEIAFISIPRKRVDDFSFVHNDSRDFPYDMYEFHDCLESDECPFTDTDEAPTNKAKPEGR